MKKANLRIFILMMISAMVISATVVSCGGDDDPTPTTPPQTDKPSKDDDKKPEKEEKEEEKSDTNYNITKIAFYPEDNPTIFDKMYIYPNEDNVFRRRMYSQRYSRIYPIDMKNLIVLFDSDAAEIFVDGVEHYEGAKYDFSKPLTVVAKADTGTEKTYRIELTHFTEIPILFIDTDSGLEITSKEEYVGGTIEIWGCGDLPGLEKMTMRIHGRGNSSWDTFKKKPSYTISLDTKQKVLGMPKHKKWVLISNYRDKTLLRNNVAWWISSHLSGIKYTPRFQHVELILNGKHRGVYQLVEQIRIDDDRVNINEMKPTDTSGDAITGGYIIELDRGSDSDQWGWQLPYLQGGSHRANIKKPKIDESNQQQHDYIKDYLFKVDELLGTSEDIGPVMEQYIDMPSWAAQWLVFELSGTPEPNGPNSWYTFKDKNDDKWYCGPPWDFDYKSYMPSTANGWVSKNYVYQPQMRKYAPYKETLIKQWEEIQPLLPQLIDYINEQREYMRYSAEENWNIHEQNLIDDNRRENGDEFIPSDEAIDRMIDYLEQKWQFVEANIKDLK